jgi:hypothetical protein
VTDARRRDLERRARAGDLEAEAQLLIERRRDGEIAPHGLDLLAYAGAPAARMALGPEAPPQPASLEAWVRGLEPWGRVAWVRAAVAAARLLLPLQAERDPRDTRPREAVEAAEAWLAADTDAAIEAAYAAAAALNPAGVLLESLAALQGDPRPMERVAAMAEHSREAQAAEQAALAVVEEEPLALAHAVRAATAASERLALQERPPAPARNPFARPPQSRARARRATEASDQQVLTAMQRALVGWLEPGAGLPKRPKASKGRSRRPG